MSKTKSRINKELDPKKVRGALMRIAKSIPTDAYILGSLIQDGNSAIFGSFSYDGVVFNLSFVNSNLPDHNADAEANR